MLSAIQRLEQKFTRIELIPSTEEDVSADNQSGGHILIVDQSELDPQIWYARLSVELLSSEGAVAPYHGNIEVIGQFKLDPKFPVEKASDMVHMNAGAILYGTIRELVYTLTSRSLHGEAELPILDARCFIPKKESEGSTEG